MFAMHKNTANIAITYYHLLLSFFLVTALTVNPTIPITPQIIETSGFNLSGIGGIFFTRVIFIKTNWHSYHLLFKYHLASFSFLLLIIVVIIVPIPHAPSPAKSVPAPANNPATAFILDTSSVTLAAVFIAVSIALIFSPPYIQHHSFCKHC